MKNIVVLLVVGLVFTIYIKLKGIWSSYKCFDDEVLNDYYHGRLKRQEDLRRQVVTHLGLCEKCQQKMFDLQNNRKITKD